MLLVYDIMVSRVFVYGVCWKYMDVSLTGTDTRVRGELKMLRWMRIPSD